MPAARASNKPLVRSKPHSPVLTCPLLPPRCYVQFAFNTLQRVSPVSHGVCNVVKRIVIIFSSVLFFNQTLTQQALVGTVIAIFGTWLYTEAAARAKKKAAEGGSGGKAATA